MDSVDDLLNRAKALNIESKFDQVEELLKDQDLDLHKNAALYVEKAQALWRLGKYKLCDEIVGKALLLDPKNAMANHYKGNNHAIQKEYESAILHYERAITYDSNFKLAFNGLANTYYLKNDFANAIIYYIKTIEIDPKFAHAYNGLGNIYCAEKKYSEGIEYLEKARDLDPTEASYYNNLGVAYQNQKKYEKALEYYALAISVDPNYIDSYINLGDIFVDEKRYIDAKKYYQKALDLKPNGRDYETLRTKVKLNDTEKRLSNSGFDQLSELVNKIKKILLFEEDCVTHYTSLTLRKF
jgi:tetratricopeptide (TPR) repeat protein